MRKKEKLNCDDIARGLFGPLKECTGGKVLAYYSGDIARLEVYLKNGQSFMVQVLDLYPELSESEREKLKLLWQKILKKMDEKNS